MLYIFIQQARSGSLQPLSHFHVEIFAKCFKLSFDLDSFFRMAKRPIMQVTIHLEYCNLWKETANQINLFDNQKAFRRILVAQALCCKTELTSARQNAILFIQRCSLLLLLTYFFPFRLSGLVSAIRSNVAKPKTRFVAHSSVWFATKSARSVHDEMHFWSFNVAFFCNY